MFEHILTYPLEFTIKTGIAMWDKLTRDYELGGYQSQLSDFAALLQYVDYLAKHKMGYPVSLLTYLGLVDNRALGINAHSLANVLLNNVGDPFKDSETSLLEVKAHEREVIRILEKYYGLAEGDAKGYVTNGGTEGNFAALWWTKRYLINTVLDQIISFDDEIKKHDKEEHELTLKLAKTPTVNMAERLNLLQRIVEIKNSISAARNKTQQLLTPTIFYSKASTHYSIPKIAEILRFGFRPVASDDLGRMSMDGLRKELILHLGAQPYGPVILIANIGTTITGAIDDIVEMRKVIDSMPNKPIYSLHLDGALSGFVMPIIKPFGEIKNYFDELNINTLAVSAHKYPGLSQPCGIVLSRRPFFEKAFEKSERNIEYVGNIVDVTISGSRSGLNVLMFYNALRTLELDKGNAKLNKMVEANISTAKYLYQKLIDVFGQDQVSYPFHFNVSFPKPSMQLAKKYQLMVTGNRATIVVLSNITKPLIDDFIKELQNDFAKIRSLS